MTDRVLAAVIRRAVRNVDDELLDRAAVIAAHVDRAVRDRERAQTEPSPFHIPERAR